MLVAIVHCQPQTALSESLEYLSSMLVTTIQMLPSNYNASAKESLERGLQLTTMAHDQNPARLTMPTMSLSSATFQSHDVVVVGVAVEGQALHIRRKIH